MKKLLYALIILTTLFSTSCEKTRSKEQEAHDRAEFKKMIAGDIEKLTDKDEKTTWADAKKLPPIIFSNKITLKDGQNSEPGLSFLLNIRGRTVLASCKHILGTAGGFKEEIDGKDIKQIIKSWKFQPLEGKGYIETTGKVAEESNNDVLFLEIGNLDTKKYTVLNSTRKLSKQKKYYLIGTDFLQEQMKIPFEYLGYKEGFFIFKNSTVAMLMGNSGGPVISENGNVVGTLKGSTKSENGQEVILVQEIPQIY
jgi:hypothetical protein